MVLVTTEEPRTASAPTRIHNSIPVILQLWFKKISKAKLIRLFTYTTEGV